MTLRTFHLGGNATATTTMVPARDLKVGQRVAYRHRNDPGNAFAYWLRVVEPHGLGGLSVVQERNPFAYDLYDLAAERDAEADPYPYMCEADEPLEVEVPL